MAKPFRALRLVVVLPEDVAGDVRLDRARSPVLIEDRPIVLKAKSLLITLTGAASVDGVEPASLIDRCRRYCR